MLGNPSGRDNYESSEDGSSSRLSAVVIASLVVINLSLKDWIISNKPFKATFSSSGVTSLLNKSAKRDFIFVSCSAACSNSRGNRPPIALDKSIKDLHLAPSGVVDVKASLSCGEGGIFSGIIFKLKIKRRSFSAFVLVLSSF